MLTLSMLPIFIISNSVNVRVLRGSSDIKTCFGNQFPYILNYKSIELGKYKIILANKYTGVTAPKVEIGVNDLDTFNNIISSLGSIEYNQNQNNPSNIEKVGGNCQAYTLLLDAMCKKCKLKSSICYNDNHMYNKIELDAKTYLVDLTKNEMKLEE